jgi:peptide/nickel transport system permease protein
MLLRKALSSLVTLILGVLLGGFLGTLLIRFAPGYGVDEHQLNATLSEESRQQLVEFRRAQPNAFVFYGSFLAGAVRGDFGTSRSLQRPVSELLTERLPATLALAGWGLAGGWALSLVLAVPAAAGWRPRWAVVAGWPGALLSGALLCVPSSVLALSFLYAEGPAALAGALVVFPRVFRYVRNLLAETARAPHVLAARAKGLRGWRILLWHVLPPASPQLLAVLGVSVSVALGASIPIEVVCDVQGIGKLAWQAAMGRDLHLLVTLTMLVTALTLAANHLSELALCLTRTEET